MKFGYCKNCEARRAAVKKPFSWGFFILTGCIYGLYRLIFIRRNRCVMCYEKLEKHKIETTQD